MKKLNKKAQGSGAISVLATVAGMLVVGAVILVFVFQFGRAATGAISAGQCKTSIELINKVADNAEAVRESVSCDWNPFAGKSICWNPLDYKWWIRGTVTADANAAEDYLRDINLCLENLAASCPSLIGTATAANASECIYKHLVTTYYTLQGGRSNPKYDFDLYKMTVSFNEPGNIQITGSCKDFVVDKNIITDPKIDCYSEVLKGRDMCGKQAGPQCNITFGEVNGMSMTLSMIAKCQQNGPDSSDCKCFADPDKGYTTANGLPDANHLRPVDATKYAEYLPLKEYGKYSGCGFNDDFTKGKLYVEIGEGDSKAKIQVDSIEAQSLKVKLSETKVCKLRLRQLGENAIAYIEGEDPDTDCNEPPADEEQP